RGIHPQTHLKDYTGILQADAFAGYDKVYESGHVQQAGCWAHARRKFYDIHVKSATPITTHVLDRIAALYQIEAGIRGSPPGAGQTDRYCAACLVARTVIDLVPKIEHSRCNHLCHEPVAGTDTLSGRWA